jgi:hypothetical protein
MKYHTQAYTQRLGQSPQHQYIDIDLPEPPRPLAVNLPTLHHHNPSDAAVGIAVAGVALVAVVAVIGVAAQGFAALPRTLRAIVFIGLLIWGVIAYQHFTAPPEKPALFTPPEENAVPGQ